MSLPPFLSRQAAARRHRHRPRPLRPRIPTASAATPRPPRPQGPSAGAADPTPPTNRALWPLDGAARAPQLVKVHVLSANGNQQPGHPAASVSGSQRNQQPGHPAPTQARPPQAPRRPRPGQAWPPVTPPSRRPRARCSRAAPPRPTRPMDSLSANTVHALKILVVTPARASAESSSWLTPSRSAMTSRKRPVRAAHLSFIANLATRPPRRRITFVSWPPTSTTVPSAPKSRAAPRPWHVISCLRPWHMVSCPHQRRRHALPSPQA